MDTVERLVERGLDKVCELLAGRLEGAKQAFTLRVGGPLLQVVMILTAGYVLYYLLDAIGWGTTGRMARLCAYLSAGTLLLQIILG